MLFSENICRTVFNFDSCLNNLKLPPHPEKKKISVLGQSRTGIQMIFQVSPSEVTGLANIPFCHLEVPLLSVTTKRD